MKNQYEKLIDDFYHWYNENYDMILCRNEELKIFAKWLNQKKGKKMTIENGWALWGIAFLSLVGAFHIIALIFRWINEWFDIKAIFNRLPMLLLLLLIGCGGGGGGSDTYGFEEETNTPPEITDLMLTNQFDGTTSTICNGLRQECIDNSFTQYPEGLFLSIDFTIDDPDLDAEELRWTVTDAEGNIVVEPEDGNISGENIIRLPQMEQNPQSYFTEDYEVEEFGGPYTFIAYVIDSAGNESPEWIEEFCILSDRRLDTTTCEDLRYRP